MTDATALPDHPIRQKVWFQLFDRLWRPATGWAVFGGVAYSAGLGHWLGKPMNEGYLAVWLTFAAAMLGLKTIEKIRGVA